MDTYVLSPRVSVITINKGRDTHRDRLLEGLNFNMRPHECVVVEMGSRATRRDVGNVRHVPLSEDGLPLALARNVGRHHAAGDILVFLDVDCIPSADLVGVLADAVTTENGVVCCEVVYLPDDAVGDGWSEADLRRRGTPHPARQFPPTGLAPVFNPGLFWSLAFGISAATFDLLGGFDTAFSGYGAEDTDFAFRARNNDIPILFSASGCAYHQWHEAYDPPLQHCADIVRNSSLFRSRHGVWPMCGWLDAFARAGLISVHDDRIELRRLPTFEELESARLPSGRPF